ncbi:MAG: ABC transporter ATP-binding protein [Alphaproteobacteria bacterium]|nr:ABC transporter ATP-binding protein [Alphaproteobacteria bacterium]
MSERAPILDVRGLAIDFAADGSWNRVVDDVSFDVGRGEVLGIAGESGSGKTVTCRALLRLLPERTSRIAGGKADFDGQDLLSMPKAALEKTRGSRISMIFQNPTSHLDPVMRIGKQIAEGLILHQELGASAARSRAIELLAEVGFREPARQVDAYPHELSGGMRQRAMIAAALACEPALLIADEPTTALDVTIQTQIVNLLNDLRRHHDLAIIFISHDLGLVANVCDRVVVMEQGRIVETAPIRKLVEAPSHPYTIKLISSQPETVTPGSFFALGEDSPPEPTALPKAASANTRPLLDISNLVVEFRRRRTLFDIISRKPATPFRAVDGVSLQLHRGEALGLVGESGSGKSTLARTIVKLIQPAAGSITFDGVRLSDEPAATHPASENQPDPVAPGPAMIFQDPLSSLNPRMTVAETLREVLEVHAICPRGELDQQVDRLMQEAGLQPEFKNRRPHQLSGGQCQRVGIARALAIEPDLLIADEPTSALDVTVQAQILNLLMRLRARRGLAMIFISHDLAVVRHLCQRIAVMAEGRLVETGTVEQIFEAPKEAYTQELLAAIPRMFPAKAANCAD